MTQYMINVEIYIDADDSDDAEAQVWDILTSAGDAYINEIIALDDDEPGGYYVDELDGNYR